MGMDLMCIYARYTPVHYRPAAARVYMDRSRARDDDDRVSYGTHTYIYTVSIVGDAGVDLARARSRSIEAGRPRARGNNADASRMRGV
jgi:hypothetical protein